MARPAGAMRRFSAVVALAGAVLVLLPATEATASRRAICVVTGGSIRVGPDPLHVGFPTTVGFDMSLTSACLNLDGGSIGFPTLTGAGNLTGTCGLWTGTGVLDGHYYGHILQGTEMLLSPASPTGVAGALTVIPEPNLAGESCVAGTWRFRVLGGEVTLT